MRSHEPDRAQQGAQPRRASAARSRGARPDPVRPAAGGLEKGAPLALPHGAGNAAVLRALERGQDTHGDGSDHEQATPPSVRRSAVHEVLRSSGRPLEEPLRAEMEARLGADFSDVRVHTDTAARRSAKEINARAYTSGSHIVVGESGADKHTLAHELTHVIQQRAGAVAGTETSGGLRLSDPTDRFERAAEANAAAVMRRPVPTAGTAPGAVHPSPSGGDAAVRDASDHAASVQRTLTYQGKELTLEEARGHVRAAQTADPTPSETKALKALIEDPAQNRDLSSGVELVRLLRTNLRAEWGLTPEQVDLFDRYQGGEYAGWNRALRSGEVTEQYGVADQTSTMIQGLARIAKTEQLVQRTLSFETREEFLAYAKQFEEGKEYTAVQFESATRRLGATLDLPGKPVYVVDLRIEAQGFHGGEISSAINVVQKSEGETVFPPGTRFKVTKAPELPPAGQEFTTTSPFKATAEMTELPELDDSKQQMPTEQEFRKARMDKLMGEPGLSSGPTPTVKRTRQGSF
ncbi:eCIS core domain-containing protein [Streptomyces buecherae]|uniref:eCIS core domain-containing protein n=1 Tax=Streptomyces buecherae TaxID=2763006 RepID=UPI00364B2EE6